MVQFTRGNRGASLRIAAMMLILGAPPFFCQSEAAELSEYSMAGTLEPYETALLYAKISGFLETVKIDIGDRVRKGDIMARLTVPEMAPQLRQAEAAVKAAKALHERAKADARLADITYKRYADLHKEEPGAIPEEDVDIANAKREVAAAQVAVEASAIEAAAAKVEELKALMSYTTIKAPFNGVVTQRFLDSGALVTAGTSSGLPLFEIKRVDILRLAVFIPEAAVPYVHKGTKVSIEFASTPGKPMEAVVERFSGELMTDTRSMRAEIHLSNGEGILLPGMYATVRMSIPVEESSDE